MLCSRAAVRLCKVDKCRCCHKKEQHYDLNYRENTPFKFRHLVGTFQSVAFLEEECSCQDTCRETNQTEDGISVTACQTQYHTERTAKEHQASDHNKSTQNKSCHRCRASSWTELFGDQ